ncbi:MAG: 3-hydroxyacyl-CoA dehydrogenase [Methylobacteriaceae bacterium]|nr:3-hydroxyacyl-CoA dehydrogenase [Methylobacteriaceae bacterium]
MSPEASRRPGIAVLGSGSIGAAWAIVFAEAGCPVNLQDIDAARLESSRRDLRERLSDLARCQLLDEPVEAVFARIRFLSDLPGALANVAYVQECIPEDRELKRSLFADLDRLADAATILASSSSFLPASAFADGLAGRSRCLVVHPGNPPYLLRVAEVVPAAFTAQAVVERTMDLLAAVGMGPVRLQREIDGFVFNRLQGALLREAYCLVRDGIIDVAEVDRIVRDGLGLRWSVVGPFEAADLNARGGIAAHAKRAGPVYFRLGTDRGQNDPWDDKLVAKVTAQRRAVMPLEDWEARVAWRDRALMALLRCRRSDSAFSEQVAGQGGRVVAQGAENRSTEQAEISSDGSRPRMQSATRRADSGPNV